MLQGHVTSFAGAQLERYTSIKAHDETEGAVLQFLFNEHGVLSLAARSVHFMLRRALTISHVEHPLMTNLNCMVFVDRGASLLVAGNQKCMLRIDVTKGSVVEEIDTEAEYTMMKHSRYICAATSKGSVDFLDTITFQVMKSWQAHTASISDMEMSGNSLITCGRAVRPHGPAMLENLAKVYDLKAMLQMPPIPFPGGAAHVQIHPKLSTTCILAAPNGQLQVIDVVNHNTSNMTFLGFVITHFIMSSSGSLWAIADNDNTLHLWGSPNKLMNINEVVKLPEYADDAEHVQQISIDEDV
ncbi:MAG: poly(A)-specific ribonuclease [Ramalina farinacea]|uniref:Poly(A)-specific ribonuclease n=1 Tax=Ramalina farinacea TaxID=258253 RepID=A0AA43QNA9_9LECA|nr:poly(A)-specific ribonuclease [Ramalina farinacea]